MPRELPAASALRTRDGLDLAVWHHLPLAPRARIVLLHGYAEHAGRYSALVETLTGAGYECHTLDLRGHGQSQGVRGHVAHFEDYLEDLDRFLGTIGGSPLPRVLVGHSLGGLLALRWVLSRPDAFNALAVSSPFLHPAVDVPWLKEVAAAAASHLAPSLLMKSGIDARWLCRDPAVVEAYQTDPLVFETVTPRWFFEIRRAQEELLERAGEIRLPVLFLVGGADPIAEVERSHQVYERLGSADKTLKVYDGFLHEVLNEVGKEQVVADLLAWLDERTKRGA